MYTRINENAVHVHTEGMYQSLVIALAAAAAAALGSASTFYSSIISCPLFAAKRALCIFFSQLSRANKNARARVLYERGEKKRKENEIQFPSVPKR